MLRRRRVPHRMASEIVPVLETRLTGQALRCYLASYFGCRMGDTIASAGVSLDVHAAVLSTKRGHDPRADDRPRGGRGGRGGVQHGATGGKINPKQADGKIEHKHKSRYTLTRDPKGVWRIADRIPRFKEWECREK